MPIRKMELITKEFATENEDFIFLFGDNYYQQGTGGLAGELRGLKNAIGISTKRKPSMAEDAFLKDSGFEFWFAHEKFRLNLVTKYLMQEKVIILPKKGLGTGLARLPEKAPKIYKFLSGYFSFLEENFGLEEKE